MIKHNPSVRLSTDRQMGTARHAICWTLSVHIFFPPFATSRSAGRGSSEANHPYQKKPVWSSSIPKLASARILLPTCLLNTLCIDKTKPTCKKLSAPKKKEFASGKDLHNVLVNTTTYQMSVLLRSMGLVQALWVSPLSDKHTALLWRHTTTCTASRGIHQELCCDSV